MILKLMLLFTSLSMVYFGIFHWPWDEKKDPNIIDAEWEEVADGQKHKRIDVFV